MGASPATVRLTAPAAGGRVQLTAALPGDDVGFVGGRQVAAGEGAGDAQLGRRYRSKVPITRRPLLDFAAAGRELARAAVAA